MDLLKKWGNGFCPLINGVVFYDGLCFSVKPIDMLRAVYPVSLQTMYPCFIQKELEIKWVHFYITYEIFINNYGLKIMVGEGAMGEDGVVAVADDSSKLIWHAFFDFSNPFDSVSME